MFVFGLPLLLLSLLAWLEDITIGEVIERHLDIIKIILIVSAMVKAGVIFYFIHKIRQQNLFHTVIWIMGMIFVLTVLFIFYIIARAWPDSSNSLSYSLLLASVFLFTPGTGMLWYFPLLNRARHT